MILSTIVISAAALLPAVNVVRDDVPPDPIYVADVADFAVSDAITGGETCAAYWDMRFASPPALTVAPTGGGFSPVDSFAIVSYEEIAGGRMTDAARDFFVSWLHTC